MTARDQGGWGRVKETRNRPGGREKREPGLTTGEEERATSAREETKGETACSHGGVSVAASATPGAAAAAVAA